MNPIMKRKYSLLLRLTCLILISCSSSDKKAQEIVKAVPEIEFSQLLIDIEHYHEKVIQTKGVYYSGIEESSLYNFELTSDNLPEKYRTISLPALWVEFDIDWNQSKSKILKSLPKNNTIVTIQGIIDTTSKGHLGQYAAAIKDAKLISSE